MVWTRLAALAVSALVGIPTYDYVSTRFDSDMLGLVAVSLLLMPVFALMRCMLDPCER